jgi:hypothetical protein
LLNPGKGVLGFFRNSLSNSVYSFKNIKNLPGRKNRIQQCDLLPVKSKTLMITGPTADKALDRFPGMGSVWLTRGLFIYYYGKPGTRKDNLF